jgi:hypothetical protein
MSRDRYLEDMARRRGIAFLLLLFGACTGAASDVVVAPSTTSTTLATTTTTTTTVPPPPVRHVAESSWAPFAVAGAVTLLHPASQVERIGFHESNHDGARTLEPAATAVQAVTMEARERGNGGRTAADVVVDPTAEIRAPVSGRVKRAGTYVLYCRHSDDYVVIAPDANPAWEVKLLHIDGVLVRAGARVVAGETVLAPRATQLPFQSQVDELRTVEPAWPHVHVEVVDPSIRDRPNPNSGC